MRKVKYSIDKLYQNIVSRLQTQHQKNAENKTEGETVHRVDYMSKIECQKKAKY